MAKPSNEAKLPVIIALVFFIIATLGVGIFAYTLSQDVEAAKAAAKTAADDKATADKLKSQAQEELLLYKVAVGNADKDDTAKLQSGITDKAGFREKYTKLMLSINGILGKAKENEAKNAIGLNLNDAVVLNWNWPANQENPTIPNESLISAAVRNVAQRQLAVRKSDQEIKALDDAKKSLSAAVTQFNVVRAKMEELNKKYPDDVRAQVTEAVARYEKYKKDFEGISIDNLKKTQELADEGVKKDFLAKRLGSDLDRAKDANTRLLDQLETGIDPFQYDKPKGKVIRRYSENLVDVDLGSADNLRAGQTFSIFPSDTPTRGMQPRMRRTLDVDGKAYVRPVPKGTLEVVDVLGSNLAQCRITSEDSSIRDRILTGDLLYNAVWNKGSSEHIVLFGIFDIDGDGRDDIQTIVQNLRKVGVAVDGYYDLAKLQWVGEITSQTTFAVEGYYPSVSIGDGNRDGKIKILTELAEVKKLAKDKGLRILRPRDFFPRIGYNAKLDITEQAINSAATYYLRVSGADTNAIPPTPGADPAKPADPANPPK